MARVYGYARVSTADQDLTVQREALIKAGVNPDLIFAEKVTGIGGRGGRSLTCYSNLPTAATRSSSPASTALPVRCVIFKTSSMN